VIGAANPEQPPVGPDVAATRAFFGPRAIGWEDRFPDDGPAYAAAVSELRVPPGGVALDAACGTGRALPLLRRAVGPSGTVIGVDVTPEMLAEAMQRGRLSEAALVLGDVGQLPFPRASVDAVLGAGLLLHLVNPCAGLEELARLTRPGGRLALFHPIGREALAARHGGATEVDDIRAEPAIRAALVRSGWGTESVDDSPDRYLVIAVRSAGS
jgi:SAM-dependent methyltransferase